MLPKTHAGKSQPGRRRILGSACRGDVNHCRGLAQAWPGGGGVLPAEAATRPPASVSSSVRAAPANPLSQGLFRGGAHIGYQRVGSWSPRHMVCVHPRGPGLHGAGEWQGLWGSSASLPSGECSSEVSPALDAPGCRPHPGLCLTEVPTWSHWPAVPWGLNAQEVPCPSHSGLLRGKASWLAEKGLVSLGFAGCVRALPKRQDFSGSSGPCSCAGMEAGSKVVRWW